MGFKLSSAKAADTADCVIRDAEGNEWVITFAGPSHPKSIALSDRLARERLNEEKRIEMARVNGKKWTPEDRTPEEARKKSVANIAARILDWKGLTDENGKAVPFSEEAAVSIFADPAYGTIFSRVVDFLTEESSFTRRSA